MEDKVIGDIQRMAVLKSIDMFKDLEIESLYQVLKIAQYVRFAKDEPIVRKGETGSSLYVILEGRAGVFAGSDRSLLTTISGGGVIGELAVLDKQERTAYVTALEDTLALEFNGDAFISLVKSNNAIAFSMASTLSQRLRNTLKNKA